MNTTDELGSQKISSLFIKLSIPAIIAQLVNIIYNIVDRIYIGRIEGSEVALSALAISLPIITLINACTMLLGTGGAPLAAIKLGEQNKNEADKILTNSVVSFTIMAVIITTVVLVFQEPLLYAFGADNSNIDTAKEYVSIYTCGTIFVFYAVGLNSYINTQGKTNFAMATVLIGAVLNIILDPIFIFVFNMGVKGAALATIISQCVSACFVIKFLFSKKSVLKIKREYFKPDLKILAAILGLGSSPFIMHFTECILQISFNNQLKIYGGTLAVGNMAILISLYQMMFLSIQGLSQGAQPILGYNYGAKNYKRVRDTFKLLLKVSVIFSVTSVGLIVINPEVFARMFVSDQNSILFAKWSIPVYFMGAMIFGLQGACQQSFLALGEAKKSLCLAVFRKMVLLIPLIYFLPMLIGEWDICVKLAKPIEHLVNDSGKVFAILVAESLSDCIAALTTGTIFFIFYKKKLSKYN